MALDTDEFLPRGYVVFVLGMRAERVPPGNSTPLATFTVTDAAGRRLCTATVTTAHLGQTGYHRVPARCFLPTDDVVSIGLTTTAQADLWLDEFEARFGYLTAEDAAFP